MTIPIWAFALHAAVTVGLVVMLWSLHHRREPTFQVQADASIAELVESITGLTHGHVSHGNAVELVENGDFFERLLADIGAAQASIHFETYLWKDGRIGRTLAEALIRRASAGVQVRVLVDARGGKNMGDATIEALERSNVTFAWFRSAKLRHIARFNRRDHRKLAIIDGRIGYAGGHCIVDTWLGDAEDREHFRDVSVRVRGPIVHRMQSTFAENWIATTGELFVGDAVFPALEPVGDTPAHITHISSADLAADVKMLHYLLIASAKQRIRIQNPYFIPDPAAIDLLAAAVERGVDVRVMSTAPEASDLPIVQHAGRYTYARLLDAGVHIYEYRKTLLHQKALSVDGFWFGIGSSNFDDRSLEINHELVLGFFDPALAAALDAIFEKDLEHCEKLDVESWSKRSFRERALARLAYLVNEQL